MRSGRLRRLVEIQELPTSSPRQSGSGERQDQWTALANVRAFVRPISGKEMRAGGGQIHGGVIDTEIEIRHLQAVEDRRGQPLRVVDAGVAYTVHAVIDPERRGKKLLLQCTAGRVNA